MSGMTEIRKHGNLHVLSEIRNAKKGSLSRLAHFWWSSVRVIKMDIHKPPPIQIVGSYLQLTSKEVHTQN